MSVDAIPADELDAILVELERAGLVEQYVSADGEAAATRVPNRYSTGSQAAAPPGP
jgi:hypothetical protein